MINKIKGEVIKTSGKRMTAIELLLVVMIISIVLSILFTSYQHIVQSARYIRESETILEIQNGMTLYKLDNGFYPSTAQGIHALVVKPQTEPLPKNWIQYMKQIPLDRWGRPFHYKNPGKYKDVDIYTGGPEEQLNWWTKITNWHN